MVTTCSMTVGVVTIWQYVGTFSLEVFTICWDVFLGGFDNIGRCDNMCLVTTCWMGVGVVTIWRMDG